MTEVLDVKTQEFKLNCIVHSTYSFHPSEIGTEDGLAIKSETYSLQIQILSAKVIRIKLPSDMLVWMTCGIGTSKTLKF